MTFPHLFYKVFGNLHFFRSLLATEVIDGPFSVRASEERQIQVVSLCVDTYEF
jgi:hypothetical protein